jgi:hypothetical protein
VGRTAKALRHQTLPQVLDGLHAARKRFGDAGIRPPWTIGISLQQDLRPTNLLRVPFSFLTISPQI